MKWLSFIFFVAAAWGFRYEAQETDIIPVAEQYASESCQMPKDKINISVDAVRIEDDYILLSGTYASIEDKAKPDEYCEDPMELCLHKIGDKWKIIYDLSSGDVPSPEQMAYIKKKFPPDFPKKLLSVFWQEQFNTTQIVLKNKEEITIKAGVIFYKNRRLDNGQYKIGLDYTDYMKFMVVNGKLHGDFRSFYPDDQGAGIHFLRRYDHGALLDTAVYDPKGQVTSHH